MNFLNYLRYQLSCIRHPKRRDFISGGWGIVERHTRSRIQWAPHLRLSKEFIQTALTDSAPESLTVLGAGRLLDVPLSALPSSVRSVHLVDADPGVLPIWKRARRALEAKGVHVTFSLLDLSGRMDLWTEKLKTLGNQCTEAQAQQALEDLLTQKAVLDPNRIANDAVVSVNLLSQIPLFWEDRVRARWPHLVQGTEGAMSPSLEQSLARTKDLLIDEHLTLLSHCARRHLILITDELFHYYERDQAAWRTEPALGLGYENKELSIPQFSVSRTDGWLWHLAPQGIEREDYGEIHSVRALHFSRQMD